MNKRPDPSLKVEHESPADQVRRLVDEACNAGNLAALERALTPPAHPSAPDLQLPQRLPQLLAAFRAAVPDARWSIEEQIAQGEAVATRLSVTGTFSGPLLGLAPPGRPATLTGVAISRFAGGRLVGLWLQADLLGLLLQLRVLPPLDLAEALAMVQVARAGALVIGGEAAQCDGLGGATGGWRDKMDGTVRHNAMKED